MESTTAIEATKPRGGRRRSRDQRSRRIARQIVMLNLGLDEPRYRVLLASFAKQTVLVHDAYEFLRERGIVNEQGELRSSVEVLNRLIAGQLRLATALGLSPAALGKLRNERPIDLAAALAEHGENAG
jgi:hypothetical protein